MSRKPLNVGNAGDKTVEEKLAEMGGFTSFEADVSELVEVVEKPKKEISNPAKEAMEAMAKYNLKQATIGVTAHLPTDDDLHLTIIAKKRGLDKKDVVLEYILKGLEKDMNKIGIFEHKK